MSITPRTRPCDERLLGMIKDDGTNLTSTFNRISFMIAVGWVCDVVEGNTDDIRLVGGDGLVVRAFTLLGRAGRFEVVFTVQGVEFSI